VNAAAKLTSNPTRTAGAYRRACWFKVACGIVVIAFLSIAVITDNYIILKSTPVVFFEEYYPDTGGRMYRWLTACGV
jgi:hypothetical protein